MSNNAASTGNTVNDQIVDAVSQVSTYVGGNTAAHAMGLLDVTGAESMGMSMHNAVSNQHNSQISSAAAVTATCAKMLSTSVTPPEPPPKANSTPPPFLPLGPNGSSPSAEDMLKQASTLAESALKMFQDNQTKQQSEQSDNQQEVKDLIAKLQAYKPASKNDDQDPNNAESKDAGGAGEKK